MTGKDPQRSGQALVIAVALLVLLGAIATLTIDVGYVFVSEARLQNASDAAALAAVHVLVDRRADGQSEAEARQKAGDEAVAMAEENSSGAGVNVKFGTASADGTFTEQGDWATASAVQVQVCRDQDAPAGPLSLFFGPLLGFDTASISATSVGGTCSNILGVLKDLSPFAFYEDDIGAPGETVTIYDGGLFAPGCFGLLNLDGGPFETPELTDWVLNGYDGGFVLDPDVGWLWVDGGTGFRAALNNDVQQRIGDQLVVGVYDQVTGEGTNANFRIVSFAVVTITDCVLVGLNKYVTARIESISSVQDIVTGGTRVSSNLRAIRLVS